MDETDLESPVDIDENLGDFLFEELMSDEGGGERDRLLLRNLAFDHASIAPSPSLLSSGLFCFKGVKCWVSCTVLGEVLLTIRLLITATSPVSSAFLK